MPALRITVVLNANQSQKAPLIIPESASVDSASTTPICALVFKTAQSKLRLKKPTRIFVGNFGNELVTDEDWKSWKSNIKDDSVLLVSAGEEYVGLKRESNANGEYSISFQLSMFAHIVLAE